MLRLETALKKASKSQSGIKAKTIRVTPEFAQIVLKEMNNSNRPMSKSVAALYANEMLRGQWKCNGEPLIFSIDPEGNDHLISGQHRLQGLVIAAQTDNVTKLWPDAQLEWDSVLVHEVAHDTADTVDTGKGRSHSDVLFRDAWVDSVIPETWNDTISHRKAWTKTLAGAARLVWLIEGGALVSSAPKFLISEMLNFLQFKHAGLCDFVTMVLHANAGDGGNKGLKMSLAYIAGLSYAACISEDEQGDLLIDTNTFETIDMLINQVAVGTGFEKGDPAWALTAYWNKLTGESGSKDRDKDWSGPFIKLVRAALEGRTGLKVSDVSLTAKERAAYNEFPILFDGWHTLCFERAAAAKAAKEQEAKERKEQDKEGYGSGADDSSVVATDLHDDSEIQQSEPAKRPRPKRKPKAAEVVA